MIPKKIKKIYLNNVDESGSNMQNREYINLNNIWHDASEEPLLEGKEIIFLTEQNIAYISEKFSGTFSFMLEDFYWERFVNLLKISR